MTPCHCDATEQPGPNGTFYCERHRCRKSPHWHQLCQASAKYFEAWEQGRGPGQAGEATRRPAPPPGVGSSLAKLLGGCCVYAFTRALNAWGPDVVETRIEDAVRLVCEEREQYQTTPEQAERLLRIAIRRAREASMREPVAESSQAPHGHYHAHDPGMPPD